MNTPCTIAAILLATTLSVLAGPKDIAIKCTIGTGKDATVFGPAKSPMDASNSKEIRFATTWEKPRLVRNSEGQLIVQPLTPQAFEAASSGWDIKFSAEPVGDIIRLTGSITYSKPELTQGVFGEQSQPIYSPEKKGLLLSENVSRTVTMHSSASPFQLFAKPGKEYEIKIRQLDKWARCRITCEYAKK
jgi:hypothetical protein